jgi:hypothetical protein
MEKNYEIIAPRLLGLSALNDKTGMTFQDT